MIHGPDVPPPMTPQSTSYSPTAPTVRKGYIICFLKQEKNRKARFMIILINPFVTETTWRARAMTEAKTVIEADNEFSLGR